MYQGRAGTDNGWIQFTNVRIPRSHMLMKHTKGNEQLHQKNYLNISFDQRKINLIPRVYLSFFLATCFVIVFIQWKIIVSRQVCTIFRYFIISYLVYFYLFSIFSNYESFLQGEVTEPPLQQLAYGEKANQNGCGPIEEISPNVLNQN